MAEFALGLTKTAVEGTLSLVKSAVEEEKKLREAVQNDLVFIGGEFEMMRSFLRVANKEHARNDEMALTLVRQLRTLAFDVEDCVEYVIHLDLDKSSRWGWLQRLWQTVNCRAPLLPLDVAVAEIKQLKARVEDVSQRNTRYNIILHGSNNNSNNNKQLTAEEPPYATTTTYPSSAAFHFLRDAWKATGKWSSNMCNLQQELLVAREGEGDHDLRVISVWGSSSTGRGGGGGGGGGGGAGASHGMATILTKAYYDPKVCEKFKIRVWVKLTHPFNHDEFVKSLLAQFCATFYQSNPEFTEGNLMRAKKAMLQQMRRQRYLVVLEDVLTMAEWDVIRMYLPDSKNGSRILLSTPQLGIARLCTGEPYQVSEVGNFSDDNQFLCAFCKEEKEYPRILYNGKRYREAMSSKTIQPVGRDMELACIRSLLEPDLQPVRYPVLVAVWGIPGVGKSTLVMTEYYKEFLEFLDTSSRSVEPSFGQKRSVEASAFAWVDVPSPFNLTDFAWRLLLDFFSDHPDAKESEAVSIVEEGCQVPILKCCKILRTRKCFVVMDGLRAKQDWDLIKATFLAEPIKGTIVVITNEEEVAMHCVEDDKDQTINITRLEANVALSLFEKIAWKDKQLTPEGKVLSKSVVDKCGGLPKVIAAMGGMCVSRDVTGVIWWLKYLSNNFMTFLETDPRFHRLRPLFYWMQSYFAACPDSIKPCIFYLSIFDAEKNIRLRRLLWRWIAEGYCRDTSDGRTCEENGEKFISELVKLSIIQESAYSNNVLCQINGFFHEYIISRQMEDNLVFALEGHCSLNSQRAGQHLTIRNSWDRDKIAYESIDFSRLRSLTVFGKWESFFICSKKVNMRLLRVLDLEDAKDVTNKDLEQIAKLLPRLKFLSIRGCREITCLPSSMGCLRQLQTLDIRCTSIVTLPMFITKLRKLRYIRAGTKVWDWEGDVILGPAAHGEEDGASSSGTGQVTDLPTMAATPTALVTNLPAEAVPIEATPTEGGTESMGPVLPADAAAAGSSASCNSRSRTLAYNLLSKLWRRGGVDNGGVMVPEDIGKLAILHTLGVVTVNNAQCSNNARAIFQELKKLTQLRKLAVSGINKRNIHEFCSAITDHAHLRSLSVELDKDDNLDGLDEDGIPEPPKTIKRLKLYGRAHKLLLGWMKHIDYPEKLHLTVEKPEELQDLPAMGPMPASNGHLRIRPIQDGEVYICPFWRIRPNVVEIQCSSVLHIKFEDHHETLFSIVEVLKVHFSGGSQTSLRISGLSELEVLKEVWLKGYTDAHKQYMQRQIDEMQLREGRARPVLKLVQPRSSS